jgi:hypothetical protein
MPTNLRVLLLTRTAVLLRLTLVVTGNSAVRSHFSEAALD